MEMQIFADRVSNGYRVYFQTDPVDPKSRHKGKLETESLLTSRGVNWTSIRPVYIYGPLNYNPVEEWFFHRLKAGRPIPIPGAGNQITQLGHVKVSRDASKMIAHMENYGSALDVPELVLVSCPGSGSSLYQGAWPPEGEPADLQHFRGQVHHLRWPRTGMCKGEEFLPPRNTVMLVSYR